MGRGAPTFLFVAAGIMAGYAAPAAGADEPVLHLAQAQGEGPGAPGVRPSVPPVQLAPPGEPAKAPGEIGAPQVSPDGQWPPMYIRDQSAKPSALAVLVERVTFTGNTKISTADLEALAAPYLHRQLEPSDVEAVRDAFTMLYIKRGYLNSGALPPQYDAQARALRITIVEGRLTEVRPRGLGWLRPSYITSRLQADKDEVLNMNDLRERFQNLLTDPMIGRANAKLLPGAEPGQAILDIDVERTRSYGASIFGNNYRPPSIGQQQFGADAWVRNLTGYGDLLDASFAKHPGGSGYGSNTRSASWRLPFNAGRAELAIEADRGASNVVDAALLPLGISSESSTEDIGLKDLIWASAGMEHQYTLGIDYVHRNSQTYWNEPLPPDFVPGSPDGHVTEHGVRMWEEYSWRTGRQAAVGRITYSRMDTNAIQQPGAPYATNAIRPVVQYVIVQGQHNLVLLDDGLQLISRMILQQAPRALPALDQMSVGGIATVRGYVENEFVRDNARVASVALDQPYKLLGGDFAGSLGPFLDWGQAKNVGQSASNIGSVGLALHASWKGLKFDLSYAGRLLHPTGEAKYGTTLQERGVELQLSYDMFPKSGGK